MTAAMICPRCHIPTNHHADKIDYPAGRIDEVHTCPRCGWIGSRPAVDGQVDMDARSRA